jgi:hypothetical protein
VFAALWERLRAASSVTAQGGGGGGLAGPIETVVVVRGVSGVDVQRKLAGLIVRAASSSTAGEMRFEAGGLLLPRTHVLIKGHVSGGRCTMRLLTDSHRVIPFVEAYLATWRDGVNTQHKQQQQQQRSQLQQEWCETLCGVFWIL